MRILQFLLGAVLAFGLVWLGVTQYMGRSIYSPMPAMLDDLPWSSELERPAHVPTALLVKTCGQMTSNQDLVDCLERNGMKTGTAPNGSFWATYESGIGFSPTLHRMTWTSVDKALPTQVDATKEG